MGRPALRIIFAPLKRHNARGMSAPSDRTLWVDPRLPWPAHTLLHEMIHIENPSWSETRVRKETARRWRLASWRQKAEWLKLLGHAEVG